VLRKFRPCSRNLKAVLNYLISSFKIVLKYPTNLLMDTRVEYWEKGHASKKILKKANQVMWIGAKATA
jgi:hypothetical protein